MTSEEEGNQLLKRINVANKNIKLLLEMMKTLEEKLDAKSVAKTESKDEEKEKINKIFEAKKIGRPVGSYETKQLQYLEMLNNGKIKQPKQQTLDYYSIIKEGDGSLDPSGRSRDKYVIDNMV